MLEQLLACAGEWHGTNMLQDPGSNIAQETTDSAATVSPLLGGRFVRIEYTWSYKGTPHSGSMLVGHRKKSGAVTLHWIDSFHNGDAVMACDGTGSDGRLDVRGSYPAPTGPDWGWRIRIEPATASLVIRMDNVSPDGEEYPAVEATYRRR